MSETFHSGEGRWISVGVRVERLKESSVVQLKLKTKLR